MTRDATIARGRPGFVLLTVMVAVGLAILVTAAATWSSRAEHAGRVALSDAVRRRAAAWSAAQAVVSLLGEQRKIVLAGGTPVLREQYPLFDDGTQGAILRFMPASREGEILLGEASLLDANESAAEAMTLVGLDDAVIKLVMTARGRAAGGRLASLEEVADQEGADGELLRGAHAFDAESLAVLRGARGGERGSALAGAGEALDGAGRALANAGSRLSADAGADGEKSAIGADSIALADCLTVFATEPSYSRTGSRRTEIGGAWVEPLRSALAGTLDEDMVKRIEALIEQKFEIKSDRALIECLVTIGVPPKEWGAVLDLLTAEPGVWRSGRIDINRAPLEVLVTLPEMTTEQASRLVRERQGLDSSERADPAWPVVRGIIEPAAFAALYPAVSTRSFFWRVRFAVGFTELEDPDGPLIGATLWECVIDLTGERARIASLRDLTMAPIARRLSEDHRAAPTDESGGAAEIEPFGVASGIAPNSERSASTSLDALEDATPVDVDSAERTDAEQREMEPSDAPERSAAPRRSWSTKKSEPSTAETESGSTPPPSPPATSLPGGAAPVGRFRPRPSSSSSSVPAASSGGASAATAPPLGTKGTP